MSRCFTLLSDSQNMRIKMILSKKQKTSSLGNPPNTTSSLSHSLVCKHKKPEIFRKHAWNLHEFWGDRVTHHTKKNSSTTMTKIRNLNHVNNILGRIRAVYLKEYQVVKSVKRNGSVKGQFVGDLFIFPGSYRPKPRPEGFRPDGLAMKQWTLHLYMQCLHFVSFHQSRRLTPIVNLTMRSHEIHTLRPLFPAMLLQKPKKIWILAKLKTNAE